MSNEGMPGTNRLATALAGRMKAESEQSLVLDFGVINRDGSLQTNTFPVPIPKSDYTVCRHLGITPDITCAAATHTHSDGAHGGHESGTGTHSHSGGSHTHDISITSKGLRSGDHVLVAWIQNEAVVIDVIISAKNI